MSTRRPLIADYSTFILEKLCATCSFLQPFGQSSLHRYVITFMTNILSRASLSEDLTMIEHNTLDNIDLPLDEHSFTTPSANIELQVVTVNVSSVPDE